MYGAVKTKLPKRSLSKFHFKKITKGLKVKHFVLKIQHYKRNTRKKIESEIKNGFLFYIKSPKKSK